MKRSVCLLLVLCCVFSLCACGKKDLDFTELSGNTSYQDITKILGNESKRTDHDDSYLIYYPDGTTLSGITAYDIYFVLSKPSDKLCRFEFWFSYKGDNIDAFNKVKASLDDHYGKAKENRSSAWSRDEYYWNHNTIWCYINDKGFCVMIFTFEPSKVETTKVDSPKEVSPKEEIEHALQGKWNANYSDPVVNQPSVSSSYKCSFEFKDGNVEYSCSVRLPDLSFYNDPTVYHGTYEIQDKVILCNLGPGEKKYSWELNYSFNSGELEIWMDGHQYFKQ